jgi:RND family efflux transporter MFP subunit
MAVDDRLSDLLVEWEQGRRSGAEPSLEELCRDTPDLLAVVRESIDSLRATDWMFQLQPSEQSAPRASFADSSRAALHDTELPASHLTAQEFAASIFQSGLLSRTEIDELKERLNASALPGEAREIASRLVTEGKLTRYQAAVLLKASKDPLLVDNYVILDTLDTGGMGLVFKALHRSMNRVVALKLLPASMMSARDTVKRFQREVQAAAALKHPNIVAAYDADESEEVAYLVLEYVEGTNLFRLVKEEGPRTLAQGADYVRQAATGLAYLHSRGIIHRDVKPANLILANDGTVKLLDMGLVRFASSEDLSCCEMDQELTQAGIVIGTVAYMSPEQALDTRSADQRSDIYSLGCTLFFLLTGRSVYHEETGMQTLLAHREQPIPSIREFCEEAPVSLDAVFRTMVAKRPADRLQTMEEVIAAIDACVPGLASTTDRLARPVSNSPKLMTAARRKPVWQSRRFRVGALITAIAAALVAGVYLAVILIRIKTNHGTVEFSTNDPNPKIEILNQPGGRPESHPPSNAGNQSQNAKPSGLPLIKYAFDAKPVPVVTAAARKGDFKVYLSSSGKVAASQTVSVRSQVDGEILKVHFNEGQIVHAGDLLFEIDGRQYQTRLQQAQAQVDQDEAAFTLAKKELDLDQKLAARNVFATSALDAQIATVARCTGALKNARAVLEQAALQLGYCRITAPITGRVGLRIVDKGNVVHAASTTKLAEIVQVQPIAVIFPVRQSDVFDLQQKFNSGNEVIVEALIGSGTGTWVRGRLAGIDNEAGPTGNVRAKATFENIDNRLFPGSDVPVRVSFESRHNVLLVPDAASRRDGNGWFVFVVKSDHTVERRTVTLEGGETDSVIKSGLSEGDLVVIEAANKLVDGSKIVIRNSSPAATSLDRGVADWVLANRGTVRLKEFPGRSFQFAEALPPTAFHIEGVLLADYVTDDSREDGGRDAESSIRRPASRDGRETAKTFHRVEFNETDIDRLASLTELKQLTFASAALTDDVLARLKKLANLSKLELNNSSLTDAGLNALAGWTLLVDLNLDSTAITDAGLKQIAAVKSLNDLSRVPEPQRRGRERRAYPRLSLSNTRVTGAGIDELQRSLPNCRFYAENLPGYAPAPPVPGSSDREWALWLFEINLSFGRCGIFTDLEPGPPLTSADELPAVDFRIVRVNFDSSATQISETALRRMASLSKLNWLSFKTLPARSFSGLSDLKQIRTLWIEETDATDDSLQVLGGLTKLRTLKLADKYITDAGLAHLAPLTELTWLRLDGQAKGLHGKAFAAAGGFTNLKTLDLTDSAIDDDGLSAISRLARLEELNLSKTWITGKGFARLVSLERLKQLQLNGCGRLEGSSLAALAKLPQLEKLSLSGCPIDDSAVEPLKLLKALHQLDLYNTNISIPGIRALQKALPKTSIGRND